jgi:DNA-binding transcriptional LysR family regulator
MVELVDAARVFSYAELKAMPKQEQITTHFCLRANMIASGQFITTFPRSVIDFYADRLGLKILPVALPESSWPVKIATLKGRTMSPVLQRFVDCARGTARPMTGRLKVASRK